MTKHMIEKTIGQVMAMHVRTIMESMWLSSDGLPCFRHVGCQLTDGRIEKK